jgi:hypothetical protein
LGDGSVASKQRQAESHQHDLILQLHPVLAVIMDSDIPLSSPFKLSIGGVWQDG